MFRRSRGDHFCDPPPPCCPLCCPFVLRLRGGATPPGPAASIPRPETPLADLGLRPARGLESLDGRKSLAVGRSEAPPLRYAIQLFGAEGRLDALGSAFDSLLDPDRQVEDDDEFTLTSSNHLLPKLIFARNAVTEFLRDPDLFPAHLSIFHEQFGVQGRLGRVDGLRRGSFVRGLVHEPETSPEESPGRYGWYRGLRPVGAKDGDLREVALVASLATAQRFAASGEVTASGTSVTRRTQLGRCHGTSPGPEEETPRWSWRSPRRRCSQGSRAAVR